VTFEEASDILAALDRGSAIVSVGGLVIRVATPSMLYRMKRDTVRPQDRADALRLREAFGLDERGEGR
jgi:hypothetical protein